MTGRDPRLRPGWWMLPLIPAGLAMILALLDWVLW